MADNESDSAFLAYVIGGLYLRRVMMVNKLFKMISVSFRVVLGVLLLFCVSTVEAQTVQKIRRKVVSFNFVSSKEEFAGDIDYVELEWSTETKNWLQPPAEYIKEMSEMYSKHGWEWDEETEKWEKVKYEEKYKDVQSNLSKLRTLKITFYYKDKTTGYLKLVGGDTESGNLVNEDTKVDMMAGKTVQTIDMVCWRTGVMSEIRYAEYEFKNLRWYNNWRPFIIGVNYSGFVFEYLNNGKAYSGFEPLDPVKGKNKLYFMMDGNDPAIILELDGPFLP